MKLKKNQLKKYLKNNSSQPGLTYQTRESNHEIKIIQ
jgi:hypothetical protein